MGERRPHHVHPHISTARVILAVKNFANTPGVCHVGLSVTAANTAKVLRRHGVQAEMWMCQKAPDLYKKLEAESGRGRPITHVIVSAPSWVQPFHFAELCGRYPEIEFVQLNHSGTSYLSIDKFGIRNIRAVIDLESSVHNLRVAFNNPRGAMWAENALGGGNLHLPNLYDTASFVHPSPQRRDHDPLRIGSFGASRPWKNQLSAAEAAVELARRLGVDLELYVNSGRPENLHGGQRMIESRKELFHDLPHAKLIEVKWAQWPMFRRIVRRMDLLFSPSFDETFLVVAADGIAEGVPSVVTGAVEWAPRHWWADPWDPTSIAKVGMGLLHDRHAAHDGQVALTQHVQAGAHAWLAYLLRHHE